MRSTRPFYSILFLLLFTLLNTTIVVGAQDDDEGEDYDIKARVMRVSLLTGEVKLKRHDNPDWERAQLNFPIVEVDTLSTATDSRLEIQVGPTNFIRVGKCVAFDDREVKLGTLPVRIVVAFQLD